MALWVCTACTAAYAVGLPCCPQCGSTDHQEDHQMPKITRAGASYEPGRGPAGQPVPPAEEDTAAADPAAPPSAGAAGEGQQTPPPEGTTTGEAAEAAPAARAQPKKAGDA